MTYWCLISACSHAFQILRTLTQWVPTPKLILAHTEFHAHLHWAPNLTFTQINLCVSRSHTFISTFQTHRHMVLIISRSFAVGSIKSHAHMRRAPNLLVCLFVVCLLFLLWWCLFVLFVRMCSLPVCLFVCLFFFVLLHRCSLESLSTSSNELFRKSCRSVFCATFLLSVSIILSVCNSVLSCHLMYKQILHFFKWI